MDNIEERVIKCVAEQGGVRVEDVKLESNLARDICLDSLDTVELAMSIEDEFGVEIPDEEAERCQTVQDIVSLLKTKNTAKFRFHA